MRDFFFGRGEFLFTSVKGVGYSINCSNSAETNHCSNKIIP
jgi:hypothetical protein